MKQQSAFSNQHSARAYSGLRIHNTHGMVNVEDLESIHFFRVRTHLRRFLSAKLIFASAILLVLSGSCLAQSEAGPDLNGQVQLQIVNTSLLSYSASKLVLGITLAMSSKRDLTVEQIVLTGLRLNGLPLYAAPVKQRLQLRPGDKTLLPAPLAVTVYLRDLDSISPLEQAISSGHTSLDGTAYATVRVNPIAALLLFSRHVEVAMSLHEDLLPFTIPGGQVVKNTALTILHTTDKALHAISSSVSTGKDLSSSFRRETTDQYVPHLMLVSAHYELRDPQGKTSNVEWHGVAVGTAPDLLLVPREAIEPWKFDPEIADAIQSKKLSLNTGSYDLWLWQAYPTDLVRSNELNADDALRLSKKDFSIVRMPDRDERKIMVVEDSGKTRKISVEKRDSPSDMVLLQLAKSRRNFDALHVADDPHATEWDSVALFRFPGGKHTSSPELIVIPAKRNGNRIELGELVDNSIFGSPIVAPEGVIGIVQNESSGVAWSEAARALRLNK